MTLFTKILLWFLLTCVIITSAFVGISVVTFSSDDTRRPPFTMLMLLQLREARYAYERGGKERLSETLRRFESVTQAGGALTDSRGIDLVTGEDRSSLFRAAELESGIPWSGRRSMVMSRFDTDGQYGYILLLQRQRYMFWFVRPQHWWVFGLAVLLCYALASYLSAPLRGLRDAVSRFGEGDLSARARLRRRDEFGQLARTFNRMADRIETLLGAERRLLQDISHELRSPLARLGVAIELARSGDETESALNRIEKESNRLNQLVGELLQVTRAEGDPSQRRRDPIRLDQLLEAIVEDSKWEAQARGCDVQLQEAPPAIAEGDQELLHRAIENVIRNALRYTPAGSRVEVQLKLHDGVAQICIRDHGPGVPIQVADRIFDPFYRVESDRNRNQGGVGLGLSIAKRAVELHRGRIRATNALPGLLVEISIPAQPVAQLVS